MKSAAGQNILQLSNSVLAYFLQPCWIPFYPPPSSFPCPSKKTRLQEEPCNTYPQATRTTKVHIKRNTMLIPIATVSHTVFSKEYSSILYITRNKILRSLSICITLSKWGYSYLEPEKVSSAVTFEGTAVSTTRLIFSFFSSSWVLLTPLTEVHILEKLVIMWTLDGLKKS